MDEKKRTIEETYGVGIYVHVRFNDKNRSEPNWIKIPNGRVKYCGFSWLKNGV